MARTTEGADVVQLPAQEWPGWLLDRDRLITPDELAAFLAIPVKTLRQWRYLGVGPDGLRIGRHVRYEPAEVRRWLREDCTGRDRTA